MPHQGMTRHVIELAITLFILSFIVAPSVHADGSGGGEWGGGGVRGVGVWKEDPNFPGIWTDREGIIGNDPYEYRFIPVCFDDQVGNIQCIGEQQDACPDAEGGRLVWWERSLRGAEVANWERYTETPSCIYAEEPVDVGQRISEQILTAFQERPIVPGQLMVQPSPHTLVGMETNVYVDAAEQVFEMVLLDQSIRIVATPTEYEIAYGDGTVYGPTQAAGAGLPQARWGEQTQTSHMYTASGDYSVTATVHFSGRYSVNGGPEIPIDGRAAVSSVPQVIRVWRAETRSVADNCLVNPNGIGC